MPMTSELQGGAFSSPGRLGRALGYVGPWRQRRPRRMLALLDRHGRGAPARLILEDGQSDCCELGNLVAYPAREGLVWRHA